jgi:hypothetical protein
VVFFDAQPESPNVTQGDSRAVASQKESAAHSGFEYSASLPRASARPSSRLRIPAPRFALPGELTQPSVVLASFGGLNGPARPERAQEAAQQAVYCRGQHLSCVRNAGTAAPTNRSPGSAGEVHWRADFREPQGRRSAGLFPPDSRNKRT